MPLFIFRATREVLALEEGLKRLERDFKAMELEWDEVYDKLRKAMGRVVKNRAIMEGKEEGDNGAGATANPALAPTTGGRMLTPRQLELQQQILKRRAGG